MIINAPDECLDYFADFDVKEKMPGKQQVDQIIEFTYDSKELQHYLSKLENNIAPLYPALDMLPETIRCY